MNHKEFSEQLTRDLLRLRDRIVNRVALHDKGNYKLPDSPDFEFINCDMNAEFRIILSIPKNCPNEF